MTGGDCGATVGEFPGVSLHNVVATERADWADGGRRLRRVPREVGVELNVDARERVRCPTGCELRFVPGDDEATVRVTLSAAGPISARVFWGPFQADEPLQLGPSPTTVGLSMPERAATVTDEAAAGAAFAPRVCRIRFEPWEPVAVHGVEGDCRPPREEELPAVRYLAHGTSITEGASASAAHLSYVSRVARRLGVDPLNLGCSGSAFCEPAMAEHLAGRDDWDLATLALSVNMANRGFTVGQFRERAGGFVEAVAGATPDRPVVAVTLYPFHADACEDGAGERAEAFRGALRESVRESSHGNLHLVEGANLMDATGLTTDLLHPGDFGMEAIAAGLAEELAPLVGSD